MLPIISNNFNHQLEAFRFHNIKRQVILIEEMSNVTQEYVMDVCILASDNVFL